MKRHRFPLLFAVGFALAAAAFTPRAGAEDLPGAEPPPADREDEPPSSDRTPPRLSHIDGRASFWREGADDWTQARVNTPLAPGDQLYVDNASNLELQIGSRDFLRAASNSQLAFDSDETDYRQFRLTAGQASLDLRGMRPGQTVEIDTPNGAFTVEHNGYYRVEVDDDATRFATRRGGRATVTPGSGEPEAIAPSEEVVVSGDDVESYAASEPDAWDRWNYQRSGQLVEAVSYRHVPDDVYGVDDLDQSGRWRVVPNYGSVWFPSRVAAGWAPYTTGRWIMDPYYGWTWVDDAPWGWAPFHYGRWVHVDDFWGWAPGPIVARPYYAPALVAFFSAGPVSIGLSFGTPLLGWTALGWGEPCRPWWGPAHYVGRPRWFGWGGPRVTINQTVVNNINVYQNTHVRNGVVVVDRNGFGRGPISRARFDSPRMDRLSAVEGALPVKSDPVRVVGGAERGARPPKAMLDRRVVATREPAAPERRGFFRRSAEPPNPSPQLVPSSREARARGSLPRPRFGEQAGVERAAPPPPPRFGDARGRDTDRFRSRQHGASSTAPAAPDRSEASARRDRRQQIERSPATRDSATAQRSRGGVARQEPQRQAMRRSAPQAESPRVERPRAQRQPTARQPERTERRASRELPGQPADRVWAGRSSSRPAAPSATPRQITSPRDATPRQAMQSRDARQPRGATSAARDTRRAAAEQPSVSPSPNGARADAAPRGRGHRDR